MGGYRQFLPLINSYFCTFPPNVLYFPQPLASTEMVLPVSQNEGSNSQCSMRMMSGVVSVLTTHSPFELQAGENVTGRKQELSELGSKVGNA